MLGKAYMLGKPELAALKGEGLPPDLIQSLETLMGRRFRSKKELLTALEGLGHRLDRPQIKRILHSTSLGWLGLDRLIPDRPSREWVEALVFALVAAFLVIRPFIAAPFVIPTSSMVPTIAVGDHIFATMFNYGLWNPLGHEKLFPQPVERGDVIIFPFPLNPDLDYIKRVVGLAGEEVEVRDNRALINGKPLDEPYVYMDQEILSEYQRRGITPRLANFGPVKVPAGHVFVMGDNRLNSEDGRAWGFVPIPSIKGRGQIIYWSHNPESGLFSDYRFDRIGTLVR